MSEQVKDGILMVTVSGYCDEDTFRDVLAEEKEELILRLGARGLFVDSSLIGPSHAPDEL